MAQVAGQRPKHMVELTDFNGLVLDVSDGPNGEEVTVSKLTTFAANTWNASAVSVQCIKNSKDFFCGVSYIPVSQLKFFMVGLISGKGKKLQTLSTDPYHKSLDFAVYCTAGGAFAVHESGTHKGNFGSYDTSSVIEIGLNAYDKIEYRVNGQVRYVSQKAVEYPLYVKLTAHDHGPQLKQLQWLSSRRLASIDVSLLMREQQQMIVALATLRKQAEHSQARVLLLETENAALQAKQAVTVQLHIEVDRLREEKERQFARLYEPFEEKSALESRCRELLEEKAAGLAAKQASHAIIDELPAET